jgi:DEAD/DEAH box helicase domain-containing protein
MSKEIVFDIETQDVFSSERKNPEDLRLSVVVIYRYETDSYETYFEQDLPKLWPLFEHADCLIGYNINHFDLAVLSRYYPGGFANFPVLDLLEKVQIGAGLRLKLDSLAQATLNYGKSGDGLQAVQLFKEGKLRELAAYCRDDVKITKELYEYGLANGKVYYQDYFSKVKREVPVDFKFQAANKSLNFSLPF